MKIIWEIKDGYTGKSRPQKLEIPDEELEDCDSTEEMEDLIDYIVRSEFEQKISYNWSIVSKNE